jgi:hypothetical protein
MGTFVKMRCLNGVKSSSHISVPNKASSLFIIPSPNITDS